MKRFFLCAVAISALCSSCETEDEAFATQTNNQTNTPRWREHLARAIKET